MKFVIILIFNFLLISAVICKTTNNKGIVIEPIPGTNLLTGVYYRISIPKRTFAILTWADVETGDGRGKYVQIDDHKDRIGHYAKGGQWYKDGVWVLQNSDQQGYVTIRNGAIPWSGYLVVSPGNLKPEDAAPEQKYLYASINQSGIWRNPPLEDNALWKIIPSKQQGKYILQNKAVPGFVIGTPRYGEFYRYMIPDTNPSNWENYGVNGNRRSKVLLEFTPITVDL